MKSEATHVVARRPRFKRRSWRLTALLIAQCVIRGRAITTARFRRNVHRRQPGTASAAAAMLAKPGVRLKSVRRSDTDPSARHPSNAADRYDRTNLLNVTGITSMDWRAAAMRDPSRSGQREDGFTLHACEAGISAISPRVRYLAERLRRDYLMLTDIDKGTRNRCT